MTFDFTHTRQMLRRLVENRSFGVGSVVELLQRGAPSVVQSQVDAKLRLERQLKQVARVTCVTCVTYAACVTCERVERV